MSPSPTIRPVAAVTGANRGLGLELCRQLLQHGWPVVALCRRSSPELEALRSDHGSGNVAQLQIVEGVDVGSDDCIALLQQALAGVTVGLLICNAGILSADSLAQLNVADIRQQFEVNSLGPLRVVHALSEHLLSHGGKVAIISSKMGSLAATWEGGKNGSVGYRMSKAAANMAGQLLALELRQRGISLLLIHPGAVTTDMYHNYWAAVRSTTGDSSGVNDGSGGNSNDGGASGAASGVGSCGSTAGMAVSTHGPISPQASAACILQRLEELTLERTGEFVQAATGELLPW